MERAIYTLCSVMIGFLVYTHYAECTSSTSAAPTTLSSSTQSSTQTTPGNAESIETDGLREFIRRLIEEGIREGMMNFINAVITRNDATTKPTGTTASSSQSTSSVSTQPVTNSGGSSSTTPSGTTSGSSTSTSASTSSGSSSTTPSGTTSGSSTSTSASTSTGSGSTTPAGTSSRSSSITSASTSTGSSSTATASKVAACPQGLYDQNLDTVTFLLEDRDCQITVYLSKPPKDRRKTKEKKGKKGKRKQGKGRNQDGDQGRQRFLEKNISIGPIPGMEIDQCPEVTTKQDGKDQFLIQTSECIMFVKKTKKRGRGKNRSSTPLILTQAIGQ